MKISNDGRRATHAVAVGNITIGGDAPIVVQSMATVPTLQTEAAAAQAVSIANAGAQLVRFTAQTPQHAANLANIKRLMLEQGCGVPLVADIHFNPASAFEAALHVEKVRINPGNFADPGRNFRKMEFTDEEYAAELEKIRQKVVPFIDLCKERHTAMRIGVNHGSLSDRIMSRFGDGAEGMVESAIEYLKICEDEHFDNVVVSIKASDVAVMTQTVRRLVEELTARHMRQYPLHLGVTEAGNALEGRIKSAVGIGSLLVDGIGDTIRVSLSEIPENEVPVARQIIAYTDDERRASHSAGTLRPASQPCRRKTKAVGNIGGTNPTAFIDLAPEGVAEIYCDCPAKVSCVRKAMESIDADKPVLIRLAYNDIKSKDELIIAAAVDFGTLLLDGFQDAVAIETPLINANERRELLQNIVQAAGLSRFKAEIVACPGCGRTLYQLPEVLEKIKAAFGHLTHLKIAVMGCIVNGPGEMAGADYGYVGGAPGKISLYRGIECVVRNIPQETAVEKLEELIKADGQWRDKE